MIGLSEFLRELSTFVASQDKPPKRATLGRRALAGVLRSCPVGEKNTADRWLQKRVYIGVVLGIPVYADLQAPPDQILMEGE